MVEVLPDAIPGLGPAVSAPPLAAPPAPSLLTGAAGPAAARCAAPAPETCLPPLTAPAAHVEVAVLPG